MLSLNVRYYINNYVCNFYGFECHIHLPKIFITTHLKYKNTALPLLHFILFYIFFT